VGVLETALQEVGLDAGQAEGVDDPVGREVGLELLAGEDVDPDVAALGERVNRDVALSDDDEAGDTPVVWLLAYVCRD
jgi:hypothetical protein